MDFPTEPFRSHRGAGEAISLDAIGNPGAARRVAAAAEFKLVLERNVGQLAVGVAD